MTAPTRTIPTDQVYWAVLTLEHAGAAARPGSAPACDNALLDELFAEFMPVALESVKPAYITIDRTRVLAAAVSRERLAALVAPGDIVAVPEAPPSALAGDGDAAALVHRLNFLWGDLEPQPVTIAKRRAAGAAAAAILLLTVAAVIGVERRAASLRASAAEHRALAQSSLKGLFPSAATPEAARTLLDQDLGRLTRTRAARPALQRDAADAVASLLTAWPRGAAPSEAPKLRTESLTATPESLTLVVAMEDRAATAALSDSLRSIAGWRLFQPQFTASASPGGAATAKPDAGTLSLRLAAESAAGSEKPGGER
ncbi:MAG: hypothetical protein Q8L55_03930 [Phycisphaerales bacterium]|nr:hypothetical protein [Phycisphaerales bacterium]